LSRSHAYSPGTSRDENTLWRHRAAAASQLPVQHGRSVSGGATDGRPHLVVRFYPFARVSFVSQDPLIWYRRSSRVLSCEYSHHRQRPRRISNGVGRWSRPWRAPRAIAIVRRPPSRRRRFVPVQGVYFYPCCVARNFTRVVECFGDDISPNLSRIQRFHHLLRLSRSLDRRSVSIDTRIHIHVHIYIYIYIYIYVVYPSRSHSRVRCHDTGNKIWEFETCRRLLEENSVASGTSGFAVERPSLLDALFLSLSLSLPRLCHHVCPSFDKRHFHVWAGPSQWECRRRHLNP